MGREGRMSDNRRYMVAKWWLHRRGITLLAKPCFKDLGSMQYIEDIMIEDG